MHKIISLWIRAGSQATSLDNVNPTRITNIIVLILGLTLTVQLPLMLSFWDQGGAKQCSINLFAILCCPLVPLFNHHHRLLLAKLSLILIYICYLIATAMHLGSQANVHYFFLLGIFVSPFLFQSDSPLLSKAVIVLFGLLALLFGFINLPTEQSNVSYSQLVGISNLINLVFAGTLCAFYIQLNTRMDRDKINLERKRSESLLLNILPASIARRLKESNQPVADYFEQATILFADIANFSTLTKQMSAIQLVALLNDLYSEFDLILSRYRLEKIKTIGDEIMAVCGVPTTDKQHAIQVCECALQMQHCFEHFCKSHNINNGLRIGINSGPVVAGVIGKNKFSYDLWGEAVNMASRMESNGQRDKIQITEHTYQHVKQHFQCKLRGQIEIKGMGKINSYWLLK
ncbi:adenylate/guanylate cyclase domain-containing protein [Neptunicella sp.]|uniref:adenylate/guanylate cyclase domain-containing protein n=1 Tax=Neptunicella sp. TaxID=2125986 RepID=UPI003F694C7E